MATISKIKNGSTNYQLVGSPRYAACTTAAATVAKVAALVDSTSALVLEAGVRICVKFSNANTAASPTLNVAGTGAKAIYWHGAALASIQYWEAGSVLDFVYNGSQWELLGIANHPSHGYCTCSTAAATVAKTASLSSYTLTTGGIVAVRFTNGITVANPTLNITSKGAKAIYYNGAALTDTSLIKAGDTVTFIYSSQYHIIAINRDTNTTYDLATSKSSTNGNVKLNLTAGGSGSGTDSVSIKGSGATSVTTDANGAITISSTDNNTTYDVVSTSANGLAPKLAGGTTKFLRADGTWAVPPDTNTVYTLPTASSSVLGGIKVGSNLSISNGVLSVPTASGSQAGVTIVYPAASCTTFSSDSGTVTPLAVQKGAKMFAITRPTSSTVNAIARFSNTTGDVKDSKIIIEDVTNTRDNSEAQVIAIPASGGKKMVYGYCTDQVDGTSFIGGVFDQSATEYPYNQGLAIGGTSGNLLWKGTKVATVSDIPTIPADKYHVTGSWSGLTYTAKSKNKAEALAFTIPTGTSATTVAVGNHSHSASGITSGILAIARGGTGVSSMTGTDYTTNRPRGIILQATEPDSVANGCIVGVYE